MKYLYNPVTGALDDVETPKLGEKYFASAETDEIIKQINDQFGPGTLFPASEAPTPPKTKDRDMFDNAFAVLPSAADLSVDPVQDSNNKIEEVLKAYGRYQKNRPGKRPMKFKNFFELYSTENFAEGGQIRQNFGVGGVPYTIFGKKIDIPKIEGTQGSKQNKVSVETGFKKLEKWLTDPTPEKWNKIFGKNNTFGRQLRAYLLDEPIDLRKGTGLKETNKKVFDAINVKQLLKPNDIEKINLLTTGGKNVSLKSIAAKTFGNLKYTMSETIDTIKNFQNGEQWLKKNSNPDAVDVDGKNIYRKYANAIKSMQSEQSRLGGFPFGDNSEKKLWSNLYRSSYRGDRIKIVGEFADGNLPINKQGKVDWKMVDKNGVPAWKRVQFVDLEAPKKTTFTWGGDFKKGNLEKQIDNTFGKGFFKKSTVAYETQAKTGSKRDFTAEGKGKTIKNNVKVKLLTAEILAENPNATKTQIDSYIKRKSPRFNITEVHHPDGVGKNPYKTEPVFKYANREVGKVESSLKAGKITQAEAKIRIDKINKDIGPVRIKLDDGYYGNYKNTQKSILQSSNKYINALKSGAVKGLKVAGKVIKPLGYALGANAVIQAKSIADEMGIELSLADKAMALDSADPQVAINNWKRRNIEGFSEEQNAITLAGMPDDFEEVGKEMPSTEMDETTAAPLYDFANGGRINYENGSPKPQLDGNDFLNELEFKFNNIDSVTLDDTPITYDDSKSKIAQVADLANPKNIPYYADMAAQAALRVGEFGARVLPATGNLISDILQKPMFKVKSSYLREDSDGILDYGEVPENNNVRFVGGPIFKNFLKNITPTSTEKLVGLDTLINEEKKKMIERGSSSLPVKVAETASLGAELIAPIFPGLKLLRAYAKSKSLPVNDDTKQLLEQDVDMVLESNGMDRRQFLQMTGAGGTVILAKMLGLGDELATATKVAQKTTAATKMYPGDVPPYFFQLVDKIKLLGKDNTKGLATLDRQNVYSYKDYTLTEDVATGELQIKKTTSGSTADFDGTMSEEYMVYKPGRADETTGKSPVQDEYDEITIRPDDEGKLKDSEDGLDNLEEIIDEIRQGSNLEYRDLEGNLITKYD